MKKRIIIYLIIFIAILLTFLTINIYNSNSGKFIEFKNNTFEKTSNSKISNWNTYDYERDANGDIKVTTFKIVDGGYNGGKCLEINTQRTNDARVSQKVKVIPNSLYKISCMVKTENIDTSGAGANISVISGNAYSEPVNGTTDGWKELVVYGRAAQDQKTVEISFGIGGYGSTSMGKAYFDDAKMGLIDSAPEGINEISLKSSANTDASAKKDNMVFTILFAVLIISLIVFSIVLAVKSDDIKADNEISLSEPITRSGRKDWIIIGAMTIIYTVIAFYNLGDIKTATNYYKGQKEEDYIVVDFNRTRNLSRMIYSHNVQQGNGAAGSYEVYYENPNKPGDYVFLDNIKTGPFFEWQYKDYENIQTSKVKIKVYTPKLAINEVGFIEKDSNGKLSVIPLTVSEFSSDDKENNEDPRNLFDEQNVVPIRPSYMNGTYFDEIYFPRTAYENIHSLPVYETTHPPLGKIIMASGVELFGMSPFGWRFMGTLFGVLMIPVMYLFGLKLFKKRFFAFSAAFLMMFDFMHLAQTRLATIDSFVTLFIMLMYYYMYDYFTFKSYDLTFKKSLKPLLLCGFAFGLGIATKWIGLYAGGGLAFLFCLAKFCEANDVVSNRYKSKEEKPWFKYNLIPTLLWCLLFFIIIPGIIYVLSYIPYTFAPGDKSLINICLANQKYMYDYHSNLNATHAYGSPWWTWPLDARPIWYYMGADLKENLWATIASFGNPAIWWVGMPAIFFSVYIAWKKKDKSMLVVFVAFAFQYFPWILVTRVAFIYHYFSAVPFLILMLVYSMKYLIERDRYFKYIAYVYLAIVFICFALYFPVLTGLTVPTKYIEALRLISSWYF